MKKTMILLILLMVCMGKESGKSKPSISKTKTTKKAKAQPDVGANKQHSKLKKGEKNQIENY